MQPSSAAEGAAPAHLVWHTEPDAVGMSQETLLEGVAGLEAGREAGRHSGAQCYVFRRGRPVLEFARGDALSGGAMSPDTLTAWFSSGKPLTAIAAAILYDRGRLDLDDPVVRYLPEFRNGKEACTVRHVLTHQGGFPSALRDGSEKGWAAVIAEICAAPLEYPPGTRAGYHRSAGWYILGELVRIVDGRIAPMAPMPSEDRWTRSEFGSP